MSMRSTVWRAAPPSLPPAPDLPPATTVVDRGSAPAKWAAAFLLVTTAVDVEVITARGDRL